MINTNQKGEIESLIGFNTPYITPENPDVVIDTATLTLDQGAKILEKYILSRITPISRSDGNRNS